MVTFAMPPPDSPVTSSVAISACARCMFACNCCACFMMLPMLPFMRAPRVVKDISDVSDGSRLRWPDRIRLHCGAKNIAHGVNVRVGLDCGARRLQTIVSGGLLQSRRGLCDIRDRCDFELDRL